MSWGGPRVRGASMGPWILATLGWSLQQDQACLLAASLSQVLATSGGSGPQPAASPHWTNQTNYT